MFLLNSEEGDVTKENILVDDFDLLYQYPSGKVENPKTGAFSFKIYEDFAEYAEAHNITDSADQVTEISKWYPGEIIKDLSSLVNLKDLFVSHTNVTTMDFSKLQNLEEIFISDVMLQGTLDFSDNSKLNSIQIDLVGDLTNAIVDIRGLTNLESFHYGYYTDKASNFDLNTCILKDSTFELTHNSDEESKYENYYYNNYIEDPDDPEYPEDPEYIVSNLNTDIIDENTSIIYGFVLNEDKTLTLGDILSREYFAEGITVKVFKDGKKVENTLETVGTGTVIKLYKGEELVEEYTIVIYGDVTGDGKINPVDALAVIKNKNQNLLLENKILEEAGRVTERTYYDEKIPTAVDALAIIKYSNGKYDIDQRYYW